MTSGNPRSAKKRPLVNLLPGVGAVASADRLRGRKPAQTAVRGLSELAPRNVWHRLAKRDARCSGVGARRGSHPLAPPEGVCAAATRAATTAGVVG
ncbi:MAG: hypothetical protein CK429_29015 [Mycobacterium sp.]|uniref:Uncharacterized protein n=1 Tax=Mycobacterium gordonae TaxID=1778 RepID=A0A1A6BDK5_MYCGO|nr:hypothetical protein A9W98_25440 [Mycobacterium gordonae]PJE02108.1 MAG: hypothetical protein CK428_30230 [Mycobacterium sp.]PJE05821.1 MAG: hypothetical protein CK429_29015 [Mycobacterium sp.]